MCKLAIVGTLSVDYANTEPAWHRNLRRSRQQARGILAAHKLGFAVRATTLQTAANRLRGHHGSAVGPIGALPMGQNGKCDWFCNRCKTKDGKRFDNTGFRTHCILCKAEKGRCHSGDKPKPGGPTKSLAERQSAQAKVGERKLQQQQYAKDEKELERLKAEKEIPRCWLPFQS